MKLHIWYSCAVCHARLLEMLSARSVWQPPPTQSPTHPACRVAFIAVSQWPLYILAPLLVRANCRTSHPWEQFVELRREVAAHLVNMPRHASYASCHISCDWQPHAFPRYKSIQHTWVLSLASVSWRFTCSCWRQGKSAWWSQLFGLDIQRVTCCQAAVSQPARSATAEWSCLLLSATRGRRVLIRCLQECPQTSQWSGHDAIVLSWTCLLCYEYEGGGIESLKWNLKKVKKQNCRNC